MPANPPSSTVFKLTSLLIVLAAFATRHAFADVDTLYVAGLAVVALWIMQAQEAAPGKGWGWVRGLAGATVLPVHALLLAGVVAGPTLFTKKDGKEGAPRFVSAPSKMTAAAGGGCGSGGCGGASGGCGGGASGGGCGSGGCGGGAGGCGSGGCGAGSAMAAKPANTAQQRSNVAMAPNQPRPGFFQVPQGSNIRPVPAAPGFTMSPQAPRPAQPGSAPIPNTAFHPATSAISSPAPASPQVSTPVPAPAVTPPAKPAEAPPVAQPKVAEAPPAASQAAAPAPPSN